MARITIPGFIGVVRITAPQRLEDHQAQVAVDCDFRSGDLRPYNGDGSTGYSGPSTGTASMFLYDQNQLIATTGDLNFARSPVFFSGNQGDDKRVFYADNTSDSAYPRVLEAFPGGGTIPASPVPFRLGIPKPAAMNEPPEFEKRSGEIQFVSIYTRPIGNTASSYNTIVTAAADIPSTLKTGAKILVTFPGMEVGPYTITVASGGLRNLTLKNTGLSLIAAEKAGSLDTKNEFINLTSGQPFWIQVASGRPLGVDVGDQIVLTYKNNASIQSVLPREKIYYVGEIAGNRFRVTNASGGNPHTGTFNGALAADWNLRYAKLATAGNLFPEATTSVNLVTGTVSPPALVVVHSKQADEVATWEDAATADVVRSRSYCVTYVNAAGDESEPSTPTDPIEVVPGSKVTFPANSLPVLSYDETKYPLAQYATPTKIRIYRTDELGTFRLVTTEEDAANTLEWSERAVVFEDNKTDAELGEPLSTQGWSVPVAGVKGLVNCPNGVVAGFRGRTVFGSVPYAPYAWPIANQVATDYDVVGLVPTSAGLVVVTKGMPSILIGDNPASWSMQKLEYPQGCVARRSIVDMGEFAIYASPDGLVAIAGANVEILTKSIMTREQWQAYTPSSIIAAQVEGRYIASYESGGTRKGFIYDPQTQSFTDLGTATTPFAPVAFANDLLNDVLLMLNPGGSVVAWNQDTAAWKPYQWHSRWFQLPIPEIMGVAQIFTTTLDLTGRDLTFKLWGYDNNAAVKIYEISTATSPDAILGNRPFRLPYVAPGRFTAFKVILEGSIPVGTVMVGRVVDELKLAP